APDRMLRIFMAPEFYFRGRYGAYTSDVVSEILPHLRQETDQPKYKDWLFVFGTAVMASFVEETACVSCRQPLDTANFTVRPYAGRFLPICKTCNMPAVPRKLGAMIDNVALVQKGGERGDRNTYLVTKEYISKIDFRRVVPGKTWAPDLPDWDDVASRGKIDVRGETTTAIPVAGSRQPWSSTYPAFAPAKFADERMGGAVFEID